VLVVEGSNPSVPTNRINELTRLQIPSKKLKGILHEAQAAFMNVLGCYTLADVLHNKNELSVFLNIK